MRNWRQGKHTIVKMQFGSHVYGTNTPNSDRDFKSVVIPSAEEILLQQSFKVQKESTKIGNGRNTKDDIDHEIFALHYWLKLLTEGQTLCYDMLFTPDRFFVEEANPVWTVLKQNSDKLVNNRISAFAGYCQSQAAKYSLKGSNLAAFRAAKDTFSRFDSNRKLKDYKPELIDQLINPLALEAQYNSKQEALVKIISIPHKVTGKEEEYIQLGGKTKIPMHASFKVAYEIASQQFDRYGERAKMAETNQGVDWKALMHAVRVCKEAEELLLTGKITFPRPEAPLLLKIRNGELPYKQVADIIVQGLDDLKIAQSKTSLPDEPDQKWIDEFICEVYERKIKNAAR